ncbi:MAG: GFA family protein [Pseudomonadota bacterium]
MAAMSGACMCGAVQVSVVAKGDHMTACNCENCRRWSGGVGFTFEVEAKSAEMTGPIKTISLLPWAERGFCGDCGSGLFWRVISDGEMSGMLKMSAGLFPDGTGLPLGMEFYADERPDGFDLSQPHKTMTRAEVEAHFFDAGKGD